MADSVLPPEDIIQNDIVNDSIDKIDSTINFSHCSRKLWAYIIIAIVVICICFGIMRMGSDIPFPNGTPNFISNEAIMYSITSISVLMLAYGAYLASSQASDNTARNSVDILFGCQMLGIILWFYYYYCNSSPKISKWISGIILVSSLYFTFKCKDMSRYSSIPYLLFSMSICWASFLSQ